MLVHEVNRAVDREVARDFEAWLHQHIDEMPAIDGFRSAQLLLASLTDYSLALITAGRSPAAGTNGLSSIP